MKNLSSGRVPSSDPSYVCLRFRSEKENRIIECFQRVFTPHVQFAGSKNGNHKRGRNTVKAHTLHFTPLSIASFPLSLPLSLSPVCFHKPARTEMERPRHFLSSTARSSPLAGPTLNPPLLPLLLPLSRPP